MRYTSKAGLYQQVSLLRRSYGVTLRSYPVDTLALARTRAKVSFYPFDSPGLYGMAKAGQQQDSIALCSYRTIPERRFDCGHEMVHLFMHRELQQGEFSCYTGGVKGQNPILEWEANAGSAELLVPYRLFLPLVKRNREECASEATYRKFRQYLAGYFQTTVPVISLRFEDLKYELHQYLSGVPIDEVELVSRRQQKLRGIDIASFNERLGVDARGLHTLPLAAPRHPGG